MNPSTIILTLASLHLAIGCTVAGWVILIRNARFDPDARGATLGFRLAVLPGAILLWPVILLHALRRAPGEHR